MVERVNGGDREALRELMRRCTRPMYDRALEITGDVYAAKDAVRRALREMAEAARHGECPANVDEWALMLAQRCCDEELYYKQLIDSMIADLPLAVRETRAACVASPVADSPERPPEHEWPLPPRNAAQNVQEAQEAQAAEQAGALPPPARRAMPSGVNGAARPAPVEPPAQDVPQDGEGLFAPPKRKSAREAVEAPAYGEHEDIFAPPKRKNARALAAEAPEEDDDEDEIYFAPPKRRAAAKEKEKVPDLFDDEDEEGDDGHERSGGGGLALLIIVLTLIAAGLLWVIAVKLKTLGYLDISDFGFADWFNENLFKFY